MIKVHFFDWDSDALDVEKELGIDIDVIDFLVQNVRGIVLEATDNEADMNNNWIFWFSAKDETKGCNKIKDLLASKKGKMNRMDYSVTVAEW